MDTFNSGRAPAERQALKQLVQEHTALVKAIAVQLHRKLPADIEVNDLIQQGMLGLVSAARDYRGYHDASFVTYARPRIQGEILDFLRSQDWVSRQTRRDIRQLQQTSQRAAHELGRPPRAAELAERMNVPVAQVHAVQTDMHCAQLQTFSALDHSESGQAANDPEPVPFSAFQVAASEDPADVVEQRDNVRRLDLVLSRLTERERLLLLRHYLEDAPFKTIAADYGVSSGRISQLHSEVLAKLQRMLGGSAPRQI